MASKTLFCSRGCVYETNFNAYFNRGMYLLSPPMYSPKTPILIKQVIVQKSDITQPMSLLNNKKLLFTYGQAWGKITIQGTVLLGCVDSDDKDTALGGSAGDIAEKAVGGITGAITGVVGDGVRLIESYFDSFRVSNYQKPINMSAMKMARTVKFFLTDYTRGTLNAELNTLDFTFSGLVLDLDKKKNNFLSNIIEQNL